MDESQKKYSVNSLVFLDIGDHTIRDNRQYNRNYCTGIILGKIENLNIILTDTIPVGFNEDSTINSEVLLEEWKLLNESFPSLSPIGIYISSLNLPHEQLMTVHKNTLDNLRNVIPKESLNVLLAFSGEKSETFYYHSTDSSSMGDNITDGEGGYIPLNIAMANNIAEQSTIRSLFSSLEKFNSDYPTQKEVDMRSAMRILRYKLYTIQQHIKKGTIPFDSNGKEVPLEIVKKRYLDLVEKLKSLSTAVTIDYKLSTVDSCTNDELPGLTYPLPANQIKTLPDALHSIDQNVELYGDELVFKLMEQTLQQQHVIEDSFPSTPLDIVVFKQDTVLSNSIPASNTIPGAPLMKSYNRVRNEYVIKDSIVDKYTDHMFVGLGLNGKTIAPFTIDKKSQLNDQNTSEDISYLLE